MRGLCGITMEVINGTFLDLKFYMELRPRTRFFKVQGMGHERLKPERRSSRFEIGSARQIQFSKNWHAHARSGRSQRRSGVHGFLSSQGFYLSTHVISSGDEACDVARVHASTVRDFGR